MTKQALPLIGLGDQMEALGHEVMFEFMTIEMMRAVQKALL